MNTAKECFLGGEVLTMQEICLLQRGIMSEFCQANSLEKHSGCKQWVECYSAKCRLLLEQGTVYNKAELVQQLYS